MENSDQTGNNRYNTEPETSGEEHGEEHLENGPAVERGESGGGGEAPPDEPESPRMGFLELIYGVLFEPGKTFKKVAAAPPLGQAVLIYFLINVLSGTMGAFINANTGFTGHFFGNEAVRVLQALVPLLIVGGILMEFIKWFVYSGLLNLLAELFGGKGGGRGVFTVYGLAGLPEVFLIPLQLLAVSMPGNFILNFLIIPVTLALLIWGVILLIMGIREVHGISTGRSALVVFTPVLVIAAMVIALIAVLLTIVATVPQNMPGLPL